MSIGFLLDSSNDAVIWRGPKKNGIYSVTPRNLKIYHRINSLIFYFIGMIRQFFTEVDWGETEYLIIDTPPGTSDEHLSLAQFLKEVPNVSAVIVTTPQEVSLLDVRKEIDFLRKVKIPILGVVENMSTFVCSKCHVSNSHLKNFILEKCGLQFPFFCRRLRLKYFLPIPEAL